MLHPTPSTTIPATGTAAHALQPGQNYTGIIRALPDGLVAHVGRIQIPLDAATGLLAGQRITIQLQGEGSAAQLHIRPHVATNTAPGNASPTAQTALSPLLQQLGRSDLADSLPTLLPRAIPTTEAALRPLITTLLGQRSTGADVQQLQQIIGQAANQGVLRSDAGLALSPWLALTALADSAAWEDLVRRARSERAATARIAQVLSGNGTPRSLANMHDSLANLARRLLNDPEFQAWLRSSGQEEAFRGVAERFMDRATGSDVQNLRGQSPSYQFLELPISADQGFYRAQIHLFSDGNSQGPGQNAPLHRTVLDVETSRLGAVWVDLQSRAGSCVCSFKVDREAVLDPLMAMADELEEKLRGVGYSPVRVAADRWDGDRAAALNGLLAPFQPLDLEA